MKLLLRIGYKKIKTLSLFIVIDNLYLKSNEEFFINSILIFFSKHTVFIIFPSIEDKSLETLTLWYVATPEMQKFQKNLFWDHQIQIRERQLYICTKKFKLMFEKSLFVDFQMRISLFGQFTEFSFLYSFSIQCGIRLRRKS